MRTVSEVSVPLVVLTDQVPSPISIVAAYCQLLAVSPPRSVSWCFDIRAAFDLNNNKNGKIEALHRVGHIIKLI